MSSPLPTCVPMLTVSNSLERAESQLFADGSMIKSLEAEAKAAALREAVANSRCETLEGETERLGRNMEAKDAM